MRNKIKISNIIGASALMVFGLSILLFAKADPIGTQVSLGNTAPAFTVMPTESPASTSSAMWNEGGTYAITATATDANSNDYYLIVCSSSTAPTPGASAAPTCTTQLCVSSQTTSGSQASCSITPTSSYSENQAWYAFVCDHTAGASCSAAEQGSGDSGSPMYINFKPTFTTAPTKPSADPGAAATFTVPSTGWGDANTGATGKLLVCATSGISNGACTGDTLCSSSATSPGNDLTCNYTLPAVISAGSKDAYVYVVDDLNLPADGAIQGSNVGYTANNVGPVIQSVTINGGNDITLQPGASTTNVPVVISVTDANGCGDVPVSSITDLWLGISVMNINPGVFPTDNDERAQEIPYGACVVGTDTCAGATDSSVSYICTGTLQSYSNPTDTTGYSASSWEAAVKIEDGGGLTDDYVTSVGNVDVNSLMSLSLPDWINYGALGPGITSGGGVINIASLVTNQGNTGLNAEISGQGQGLCIDSYSATCPSHYIALAQQKWEIANNTTNYASGSNVLSTTPAAATLNILKRTAAVPTRSKSIYWGISIPTGQALGSYYGQNLINGVISSVANW